MSLAGIEMAAIHRHCSLCFPVGVAWLAIWIENWWRSFTIRGMKRAVFFFAVLVLVVSSFAEETKTITGQIFIRTEGGENLKLSLVDVLLYDEKVIAEDLGKKRREAQTLEDYFLPRSKAAKKAFDAVNKLHQGTVAEGSNAVEVEKARLEYAKINGKADYPLSAFYYFSELPSPLQTTKTDADGKFTFKVPSGSYALLAESSRLVGRSTEHYHWMVKVSLDTDKNVMLANDNLSSSGSRDSLILTTQKSETWEALNFAGITLDALRAEAEIAKAPERKKEAELRVAEADRQERQRQVQLSLFRKNPALAQNKAIELYPELGVAGSLLNKEFVARTKRYQTERKEFFAEPDWPIRLAKECQSAIAPPSEPPPASDEDTFDKGKAAQHPVIEAKELLAVYNFNEFTADQHFKGNSGPIRGSITNIGRDNLDVPYVILDGSVHCAFPKDDNSPLTTLSKGQVVVILGKVRGKALGMVAVHNCSLISLPPPAGFAQDQQEKKPSLIEERMNNYRNPLDRKTSGASVSTNPLEQPAK